MPSGREGFGGGYADTGVGIRAPSQPFPEGIAALAPDAARPGEHRERGDLPPGRRTQSSSPTTAKIMSVWASGRKLTFWMPWPSPSPVTPPEPMPMIAWTFWKPAPCASYQ